VTSQDYLPLDEAARRLGISRDAAYELMRRTAPKGTVRTANGRWMLTEAAIERLRQAQAG
jgi:predicted site-specific integrase-resolvase